MMIMNTPAMTVITVTNSKERALIMKRFVVGVITGFHCMDNEVSYEYTNYFFDTYSEARWFRMRFPKGDTYLMDLARLPF